MRNQRQRTAKITIQAIVVGTAALIGGATTVPMMMKSDKSAAPIASVNREMAMLQRDEQPVPLAAFEPLEESTNAPQSSIALSPPPSPTPLAKQISPPNLKTESSSAERKIEHVRVFYATDRQLFQANNPHLWFTAVAPGFLCVLLTLVLIAGCFASKRRWGWGIGSFIGIALCFVMVGQSALKIGKLLRLSNEGSVWFSTGRFASGINYPLHLGTSDVSLPPNHQAGTIEQPSIFSFEFEEREDRHVMVRSIKPLDTDTFYEKLANRILETPERSALVNIHGYNVTFDDALLRTAQLAKDIGFDGAPILYSWPSNGQLLKYRRDESNVEWSVAHLERFLADIHQRTGVMQIHVIAHSMGNRALVGALQLLQLRYPEKQPMLAQVILAAPDLDAEEFRDRYASAVDACAAQVTLYSSATDRALLASMQLHGHRRLGLTSSPQPTVAGVDLVDVTPVDTSLLGHSYYGSHPLMIRELVSLIHQGVPPKERAWLTTLADLRVPPLWRFIPELATEATNNY